MVVTVIDDVQATLDQLLTAVERLAPYGELELVVIDNATGDATQSALQQLPGAIKTFRLDQVYEGMGLFEQGIRVLDRSEFALFLSNAVELDGSWLQEAIDILRNNNDITAVAPKIKGIGVVERPGVYPFSQDDVCVLVNVEKYKDIGLKRLEILKIEINLKNECRVEFHEFVGAAPFPPGHFYSPVIDIKEVSNDAPRIWPREPNTLGIDFQIDRQRVFINGPLAKYTQEYSFPFSGPSDDQATEFYEGNDQFAGIDSRALFAMLRDQRPSTMIEVGSGYSSLLTAQVNREHLQNEIDFRCIEPFPREFLRNRIDGISDVIVSRVQDVDVEFFSCLDEGDILFIDSSHVSKTGSDVNYLYFDVLPILKPGVIIHIHDVPLPHDYMKSWVLRDNRSWNELYLLRALLMHSNRYSILFGSAAAAYFLPIDLNNSVGPNLVGGSMWLLVN